MGTFQDTVKYLHRSGDGDVLQMIEVWLVLWSETRYSLVRLGMRTSAHQAVSTVRSCNGLTLPDWPSYFTAFPHSSKFSRYIVSEFKKPSANSPPSMTIKDMGSHWTPNSSEAAQRDIELPWKEGQKKQNSDRQQEVEFTRANGEAFWMCYGFWRYLWVTFYGSPLGSPLGCTWRY